MNQNVFILSLKFILVDLVLNILYFPVWWYGRGLLKTLFFCGRKIKDANKHLGLGIWVKNLFKPMYGQRDIAGKIISFIMRLVQIFFRGVFLLIFILLIFLLILIWLVFPIVIIYQIIGQLFIY